LAPVSVDYLLYGLHIAADREIPGLLVTHASGEPDLRVHFSGWPDVHPDSLSLLFPGPQTSDPPGISHRIFRNRSGDFFLVTYPDGTEFAIDDKGGNVWVRWTAPLTLADAVTYLVGPIIGFFLRRRGQLCLHAGCVRIGDAALAIAGSAGAGKSTTVSAFALAGYSVLSDDITPIVNRAGVLHAVPGYPRLCLWPESATALFGHSDALPQITPSWDKRFFAVDRHGTTFETWPVPLAAIYLLGDRSDSGHAPALEPLAPERAFLALIGHSYANSRLDPEMRAAEFSKLDELVRVMPVRAVTPHASIDRLTELVETIAADFRALPQPA
jgi:hypothetical protein